MNIILFYTSLILPPHLSSSPLILPPHLSASCIPVIHNFMNGLMLRAIVSIYLSIYPSTYLSTYLSMNLSSINLYFFCPSKFQYRPLLQAVYHSMHVCTCSVVWNTSTTVPYRSLTLLIVNYTKKCIIVCVSM